MSDMITLPPMDYSVLDRIRQSGLDRDKALDVVRERQNLLEDIKSQRQFAENAAGLAAKRRMKEMELQDNLNFATDAAKKGVVTRDAEGNLLPRSKIESDLNAKNQEWADSVYKNLAGAKRDAEFKVGESHDNLVRIASELSIGNPTTRREALKAALSDPSSSNVPDKIKAQLWAIARSSDPKSDPATAMDDTVQAMQKFWGSKGMTQGKRDSYVAAFLGAYNNALKPYADTQQKDRIQSAAQEYQNSFKLLDDSSKAVAAHVSQFSRDMSPDLKAKAMAGPARDQIQDAPAAPMIPSPVMPAGKKPTIKDASIPTSPPMPGVGEAFDQGGVPAALSNLNARSDSFAGNINAASDRLAERVGIRPSNKNTSILDAIKGAFMKSPSSAPPSSQDVANYAKGIGFTPGQHPFQSPADLADLQKKVGDPSITADEVSKLKSAAMSKFGMSEQEADQHEQALKAGDPNEISKFKQGLKMLRSGGLSDAPVAPLPVGGDQATATSPPAQ